MLFSLVWQHKQHCAVLPDTHYCTSDKTQELLCLPCLVLSCWGRAGLWGVTCMRSVLANLLFILLGRTFINKALFILRSSCQFYYSLAVTHSTVKGLLVFLPQTHLNIWHKKSNNTALEKSPIMLLPLQLLTDRVKTVVRLISQSILIALHSTWIKPGSSKIKNLISDMGKQSPCFQLSCHQNGFSFTVIIISFTTIKN